MTDGRPGRVAATLAGLLEKLQDRLDDLDAIRLRRHSLAEEAVNLKLHAITEDFCRLLAAVDAALEAADEWDAKAREIGAQITYQDTEGAVAAFKMIGVTRYQEDAKALRAAITAALTGVPSGD